MNRQTLTTQGIRRASRWSAYSIWISPDGTPYSAEVDHINAMDDLQAKGLIPEDIDVWGGHEDVATGELVKRGWARVSGKWVEISQWTPRIKRALEKMVEEKPSFRLPLSIEFRGQGRRRSVSVIKKDDWEEADHRIEPLFHRQGGGGVMKLQPSKVAVELDRRQILKMMGLGMVDPSQLLQQVAKLPGGTFLQGFGDYLPKAAELLLREKVLPNWSRGGPESGLKDGLDYVLGPDDKSWWDDYVESEGSGDAAVAAISKDSVGGFAGSDSPAMWMNLVEKHGEDQTKKMFEALDQLPKEELKKIAFSSPDVIRDLARSGWWKPKPSDYFPVSEEAVSEADSLRRDAIQLLRNLYPDQYKEFSDYELEQSRVQNEYRDRERNWKRRDEEYNREQDELGRQLDELMKRQKAEDEEIRQKEESDMVPYSRTFGPFDWEHGDQSRWSSRLSRVAAGIQAVTTGPGEYTGKHYTGDVESLARDFSGRYVKWVHPTYKFRAGPGFEGQPIFVQKIKPQNTVLVYPNGEAHTMETSIFYMHVQRGRFVLTAPPEEESERVLGLKDLRGYVNKEFRLTNKATRGQDRGWTPVFKVTSIRTRTLFIETSSGRSKEIQISSFLNALEKGQIEISPFSD